MKKWVLRIRQSDKAIFDAMKLGQKTIETRAGTSRYQKIEKNDILIMICGKDRQEFKVQKIDHFSSVKTMFDTVDYQLILPGSHNREDAKKVYHSFQQYKEKINQFGIFAFYLTPIKGEQ